MENKRRLDIRYYPMCVGCRRSIDDKGQGIIIRGNINVVDVRREDADGGGIIGDNFPSTKDDELNPSIKPSETRGVVGRMAYHLDCFLLMAKEAIHELSKGRT